MSKTVLMFSGGLDSTAVFYKLLKEKQNLFVHHMHLNNKENRAEAESIAVKKICGYMKQFGDFVYSESRHEVPTLGKNFMWDSDLYNFMAGSICNSLGNVEFVALGMTKSDLSPSVSERANRGTKIFESFGTNAKKIYPIIEMTKKEIYDYLPEDLRELTWSCRTPIYEENKILKCNKCKACRELRRIISPKQQ